MHELSLVEEILRISADASNGRPVTRVVLKVGQLSCVMPEALRFCFDSVKAGTVLQNATLELHSIPGRARCQDCGADYALEELYQPCACGSCRRTLVQGQELVIQTVECE